MKIVFVSETHSPSFGFYAESLGALQRDVDNVSIDVYERFASVDYQKYEVALFMGQDEQTREAKARHEHIVTGVFDPRGSNNTAFAHTDFIAANDIESRDYFLRFCPTVMVYYTYPLVPSPTECPWVKDKLVVGYHGNVVHLNAMHPRITDALIKLNTEISLELWVMYNREQNGTWELPKLLHLPFPVRHIQYRTEHYARYMAHIDVGIVPQLIPVRENKLLRFLLGSFTTKFNERSYNFILRFKETTNRGRHLVFAQYGIPVVSDMTPSACDFIDNGENGYTAYHTEAWYSALKTLGFDRALRQRMGASLREKYERTAAHAVLNRKLVSLLELLCQKR